MNLRKRYNILKISKEGIEYVIPYGKSKFIQFFYIYNPLRAIRSYYKLKTHIMLSKYNCRWIKDLDDTFIKEKK